uniref:Uncharacterized protein n=1 Tax=Anguilla anguilla TaxID=7936 RepID=A0A0E9P733_ANGAN
MHKRAQSHS